jgi:hypothetical protein
VSTSEPSRLEGRKTRRFLLAFIVVPPAASVVAATVGVINLLASVAIIVSAELVLLALLLELALRNLAEQHSQVRGFIDDNEAMPHLCRYVEDQHPKMVDLIEYSAFGAMPLLAKLAEVGSTRSIRLLVGHPASAISDYQRDYRLAEALRALAYRVPPDQAIKIGLQIRCYREHPSIRGRLLNGKLLVMGWYSFDDRGLADPGGRPVAGGSNALVAAEIDHEVGQRLGQTYKRTFDNLWRDASEVNEAWEPYRAQLPQLPAPNWLQAVRAK